jgi:hypothetical protein
MRFDCPIVVVRAVESASPAFDAADAALKSAARDASEGGATAGTREVEGDDMLLLLTDAAALASMGFLKRLFRCCIICAALAAVVVAAAVLPICVAAGGAEAAAGGAVPVSHGFGGEEAENTKGDRKREVRSLQHGHRCLLSFLAHKRRIADWSSRQHGCTLTTHQNKEEERAVRARSIRQMQKEIEWFGRKAQAAREDRLHK